ncbi:MAG: ABC transporter ATP-binding protein [Pseudomonadota bacterium]
MARLDLEGLGFGKTEVLGRLSIDVEQGETLAILGPSGIGKTSLLRIFAGLETGYRGKLQITSRLAFVFQEPTLLPWRKAICNITLATGCTRDVAANWLDRVGIAQCAELFPGQMSLGQQRRLSLARAFASKPELLLMDEPFVSLDPQLVDEMLGVFEALRAEENTTTLFVTHAETEATRLASRIIRLGGKPATIKSESRETMGSST